MLSAVLAAISLCLVTYNIWISIKHHKNPSKASLKKVLLFPFFAYLPIAAINIMNMKGVYFIIGGLVTPFIAVLVIGPIIFIIGWVIYKLYQIILIPISSVKKSYDNLPDDIRTDKKDKQSLQIENGITMNKYGQYLIEGLDQPFETIHTARIALNKLKDKQ
jgi:hypothetical protein